MFIGYNGKLYERRDPYNPIEGIVEVEYSFNSVIQVKYAIIKSRMSQEVKMIEKLWNKVMIYLN